MYDSKIFQRISEKFFVRKPEYLAFLHKRSAVTVITMPLVMTQSLHANTEFQVTPLNLAIKSHNIISLTRRFERRLLSAFNKKVIAGHSNILKKALCASSGLQTGIDFERMLRILIERKEDDKFIDRHFRHISPFPFGRDVIDIDKNNHQSTAGGEVIADLFKVKLKSTEQVNNRACIKRLDEVNEVEVMLLKHFESLF